MATNLPNGIGETLGDQLVTGKPLFTTGAVIYVSSATGNNAYTGLTKTQPKATLAGAQTAASNGDIVVLLDGHTEGYTSALTISKNITIVGSGSASGVPTVNFRKTSNYAGNIFTITAAGVQLRNVKIRTSDVSTTFYRVSVQASSVSVIGCYFECGNNDPTSTAIQVNASLANFLCKNCTFISTATAASTAPGGGIEVSGVSTDFRIEGCVFDGGTYGFNNGISYEEQGAPTRRYGEQLSFLRGADYVISAAGAQSYWQPTTTSGDVRG